MRERERVPAAHKIQRRMRARILYRQRRDRKIPVDLLGREYVYHFKGYTNPCWFERDLHLRLVRYNPQTATVVLAPTMGDVGTVCYSTDDFWSLLKLGILEEK